MSITDPRTVLVLGAGSSAPFGLPLGGALIGLLERQIGEEERKIYPPNDYNQGSARLKILGFLPDMESFWEYPIHSTVATNWVVGRDLDREKWSAGRKQLSELRHLLKNQTSETIDDFIVQNPSYALLTKQCVAGLLLTRLCECKSNSHIVSRTFDERYVGDERNWIHLLINIVREGARLGHVTANNRVQIVTFNYDTILEFVLEQQFSNSELFRGRSYQEFVEIVHVHGKFGLLSSDFPASGASIANAWSKGLHVVNEGTIPKSVAEERHLARTWVTAAKEIYTIGFSFAAPNCRLLSLQSQAAIRRKIVACNFDGNAGLREYAQSYGSTDPEAQTEVRVIEPSIVGTRLGTADFIMGGYLGELPG